jgi:protein tyrosine/serine phosphatase
VKTILVIVALAFAGCTHESPQSLPNFAEVEPGVYRGGQPTARGWEDLKALGVQYDIKLDTNSEASDAGAAKAGIFVHFFPISLYEQTLGTPKPYVLEYAPWAIGPGTYIHCEHGQDRTGLIVGLYRLQVEHWTKARAYAEMRAHGFHPELLGLCRAWDNE